jgi:hypothetical protein
MFIRERNVNMQKSMFRNGLVNMSVMPVTMIDNTEIKLDIYLLF